MKTDIEIHADGDIFILKEDGSYHYSGFLCSEDENITADEATEWLLKAKKKNSTKDALYWILAILIGIYATIGVLAALGIVHAQTQVTASVEPNPCSDCASICNQYKAEHNIK